MGTQTVATTTNTQFLTSKLSSSRTMAFAQAKPVIMPNKKYIANVRPSLGNRFQVARGVP